MSYIYRLDSDNYTVKDNGNTLFLDFGIIHKDITITYSDRPLLRYPGGKSRAVKLIASLIPKNITELCSPFLGGGSVELYCAARGIKVTGYDVFQPLVEFWQHALNCPNSLANEVEKYYPLERETFYRLQKLQNNFSTSFERAAIFYVLNRSSYSGSTLSGGMSPNHPRFTLSSINRLRNFYNPNIQVEGKDFKESIPLHKNTFLYLDPPYLIENHLYGRNGDAHKDFDHQSLNELLINRENWILIIIPLKYSKCIKITKYYTLNGNMECQMIKNQKKYSY